tara:strand:- start:28146 stop:28409 length:264 start_codon:yes stop_codon:yes gene_type:complete
MFTIRFEYIPDDAPMHSVVLAAKIYGVVEAKDGSREVFIPNEHDVRIYHTGFSRAFVMNDAGATVDKIDNRGRVALTTAHEGQSAAA